MEDTVTSLPLYRCSLYRPVNGGGALRPAQRRARPASSIPVAREMLREAGGGAREIRRGAGRRCGRGGDAVADAVGNHAKSRITSSTVTNCSRRSSSDVTTSEFRTKEPTNQPTAGTRPNPLALATSNAMPEMPGQDGYDPTVWPGPNRPRSTRDPIRLLRFASKGNGGGGTDALGV
jgi:hypothetical protein